MSPLLVGRWRNFFGYLRCNGVRSVLYTISRDFSESIRRFETPEHIRQHVFFENDCMYSYVHNRLSHLDELPEFRKTYTNKLIEDVRGILTVLDKEHPGQWSPGIQDHRHTIPKNYYEDLRKIISDEKHSFNDLAQLLVNINHDNATNLNVSLINYIVDYPLQRAVIDSEASKAFKVYVRDAETIDLDTLFYTADIYYRARMRPKLFKAMLISFLKSQMMTANEKQIMHALFYLNLIRQNHGDLLQKLQTRLKNLYKTMDAPSLMIVSLAHFKTKTILNDEVSINLIIDRFAELLPTMDPNLPYFAAIMKILRFSIKKNHPRLREFIDMICEPPYRKVILSSQYNIIHTLRVLRELNIVKPNLLEEIGKFTVENLASLRIKEYASIMESFARSKLDSNEDVDTILEYIGTKMSRKEILEFPLLFFYITKAAESLGRQNQSLLDILNDKEFQESLSNYKKERAYL